MTPEPVEIQHFSDVLCVWAYVGHRRVQELVETYGDRVAVRTRYCPVFTDVVTKIETRWRSKGGFEGYADHVQEVVERFSHVELHPRTWRDVRPSSSAGVHLFLKAVEVVEQETAGDSSVAPPPLDQASTRAAWELRQAFFARGEDIADWQVQRAVAERLSLDHDRIQHPARTAEAAARLAQDYESSQDQGIAGSPTFVLNAGRQKLFGNLGYRLLQANVEEVLRERAPDEVSWC